MFKKIYLTASIAVATTSSFAQKITINWGAPSKPDIAHYKSEPGLDKNFIALGFEKKGSTIRPYFFKYDEKLNKAESNQIAVDEEGVKFDNFFTIKNKIYFFTNLYDNKERTTTFYCQPYSIQSLKPEGPNLTLAKFSADKKSQQSSSSYTRSQDSTKVLMMGLSPYKKDDNEKYYLAVYNEDMQKIWDKTVELSYKDKNVVIISKIVTNDGKVGLITKIYDKGTSNDYVRVDGKKIPSYSIKMLLYSPEKTEPIEFSLNSEKFINAIHIVTEDDNQIELFGLYSDLPNELLNGYFITRIDKHTRTISNAKFNEFPSTLLEIVEKDKQGDNGREAGISKNFSFYKYVKRDNGVKDYLLQYKTFIITRGQYASYVSYKSGDILDISIDKNNTQTITRIPLLAYSAFENGGGFQAIPFKNDLFIFYNDGENNIENDLNKPVKSAKSPALAMARIHSDGTVKRTWLYNKNEKDFTISLNESFRIGKSKIALYSFDPTMMGKVSKYKIGTLEIE